MREWGTMGNRLLLISRILPRSYFQRKARFWVSPSLCPPLSSSGSASRFALVRP